MMSKSVKEHSDSIETLSYSIYIIVCNIIFCYDIFLHIHRRHVPTFLRAATGRASPWPPRALLASRHDDRGLRRRPTAKSARRGRQALHRSTAADQGILHEKPGKACISFRSACNPQADPSRIRGPMKTRCAACARPRGGVRVEG